MTSSKVKNCTNAIWYNLKLGYESVTPHYCILLHSIVLYLQRQRSSMHAYTNTTVCVHMCVCAMDVCARACICMCACVLACMCVIVITAKMEWNQLLAHYILTTFPLSVPSLFIPLTALLMATPW